MKMKTRTKIVTGAALAVGVAVGAAGIASATGGDDAEAPITGDAFDKASAAALDHTGEGTVSESEVGDEDSYYEVEVTLDDGSRVDVQLDEDFNVVDTMVDDESPDDSDAP